MRRSGDLQGFVPADFEVSGVHGGGFPSKGKNSGKIEGAFYVSTLEVKGGHHEGGAITATTV